MYVVATAGHVDHGKSTLVRALTGMESDRFAEERRRGLTIELGYVWTTLPTGETLAFVDVPGHERFLGTMLAGLGPAPAVLFVVAADEGWRAQSEEHLAAVTALGLRHGLLVVTRSDLADPRDATAEASARISRSTLGAVPSAAVSAVTGAGLPELRAALRELVAGLPDPRRDGRLRFWVDRAFTIRGAGTVVTGTLGAGALEAGQELQLAGRRIRVRGLETLGEPARRVEAVARVAVNLRGVEVEDVARGDALLSPDAWATTVVVDARCSPAAGEVGELATELVLHVGTAAVPVRVRPLGADVLRLKLDRPLPLEPGDRLVLRDPGRHAVTAGAVVLDVDPPELTRRGAAAARAAALQNGPGTDRAGELVAQVRRRGAVRRADLEVRGVQTSADHQLVVVEDWLVDPKTWQRWQVDLRRLVDLQGRRHPLDPRVRVEAARHTLDVPDRSLMIALVAAAGLQHAEGRISRVGADDRSLGAAEAGLVQLEEHLRQRPFEAPEKPELDRWALGVPELAAAERVGRVVRLSEDVVLLPAGPAQAIRVLAGLPQPFTTSEARAALGTTRRVAVPLLEHLDRRGWTVRIDPGHRRVRASEP